MSLKMKLGAAGCVIAVAVVAALVVLLPAAAWQPPVIVATALLALLLGGFLYLPAPLAPSGRSEEARLALLGPSSAALSLALALAIGAMTAGLHGLNALSWVLSIVTAAVLLTSAIVLHASSDVIDDAAASQPDNSARIEWQGLLEDAAMRLQGSPQGARCARIAEDMRYSASSVRNRTIDEDASIRAKLLELLGLPLTESNATLAAVLDEVESLIARRQKQLVVARTKA